MSKIATSAFFAGVVCKMYDDLVDNPKLKKYKTEFLLELLKGLHYILGTFISMNDAMYLIFLYATCLLYTFSEKKSFVNPYEHSFLYSCLIVFLLIDYNFINSLPFLELLFILIYSTYSYLLEPNITKKEYSLLKLIIRIIIFTSVLSGFYINFMPSFKHISTHFIGYFGVSIIIQCYSLLTHKNKKKRRNKKNKINRLHKKEQRKRETTSEMHVLLNKYISNQVTKHVNYFYPAIIVKWMNKLDKIQNLSYIFADTRETVTDKYNKNP